MDEVCICIFILVIFRERERLRGRIFDYLVINFDNVVKVYYIIKKLK